MIGELVYNSNSAVTLSTGISGGWSTGNPITLGIGLWQIRAHIVIYSVAPTIWQIGLQPNNTPSDLTWVGSNITNTPSLTSLYNGSGSAMWNSTCPIMYYCNTNVSFYPCVNIKSPTNTNDFKINYNIYAIRFA